MEKYSFTARHIQSQTDLLALSLLLQAGEDRWKEGEADPSWVKRDKSGKFSSNSSSNASSTTSTSTANEATAQVKQPFSANIAKKFDSFSDRTKRNITEAMFGDVAQERLATAQGAVSEKSEQAGSVFAEKSKQLKSLASKSFSDIHKKQKEILSSTSKFIGDHKEEIAAVAALSGSVALLSTGLGAIGLAVGPIGFAIPAEFVVEGVVVPEVAAELRAMELAIRAVAAVKGVAETSAGIGLYAVGMKQVSKVFDKAYSVSSAAAPAWTEDCVEGLINAGKTLILQGEKRPALALENTLAMLGIDEDDFEAAVQNNPSERLDDILKKFHQNYVKMWEEIADGDVNNPKSFLANRDRIFKEKLAILKPLSAKIENAVW